MSMTDLTAAIALWRQSPTASDRQSAKSAFIDIVQTAFLFFCFFPYLAPVPLPTDVQPYALILSLIVCAFGSHDKPPKEIWLLAVAPFSALIIWLVDDQSFYGFRETLSFLSPLPITLATMIILNQPAGASSLRRFIAFSTYTWLFFGLLERLINPDLLVALIPHISVDEARGVSGLATEPSFYGVYCLFLLLLNYLCNSNDRRIMYLLLFQIVVLAQSSVTILLMLIYMLYRTILFPTRRQIAVIIFLAISAIGLLAYVLPQLSNLRLATLAINLVNRPMVLFQVDTSINARAGHVLFSVLGFLDNYGLPRGFDHFTDYILRRANSLDFPWLGGLPPHLKIMSGYGAIIFELGILGLLTPLAVAILIFKYFRNKIRSALLMALYISTIMFSAIQISLPLFGIFLGWLAKMRDGGEEHSVQTAIFPRREAPTDG